jgi:hypothetical protein
MLPITATACASMLRCSDPASWRQGSVGRPPVTFHLPSEGGGAYENQTGVTRTNALPEVAVLPPVQSLQDIGELFSGLELQAIEIGKRDPVSLFKTTGRAARIGKLLFGIEQPRPLADRRLEGLRLLVLKLRHSKPDLQDAIEGARAAGISQAQVESLLASLSGKQATERQKKNEIERPTMTWYNNPSDRLTAISQLIAEALTLADEGSEPLLGAKLCEAQACADERAEGLDRKGRSGRGCFSFRR